MKSRTVFLIIFTFLFINFTFGQSENGVVYYTDIESLGAPGANLKVFNAVLYFSPKKSLYVTKVDSLENGGKNITKTYEDNNGTIKGIKSSSTTDGLFNIIDRKKNILFSNARFKSNFNYHENVPKINWKITNDTKKIEDIEVTRATTRFRGRNYTAWFAPEIAVPLGPWKLQGLPGLILEAYDDNKEIMFVFRKLEYPHQEKINFPDTKVNSPNLQAMKEEQDKNFKENLWYQRALSEQHQGSTNEGNRNTEYKKRFFEIFE